MMKGEIYAENGGDFSDSGSLHSLRNFVYLIVILFLEKKKRQVLSEGYMMKGEIYAENGGDFSDSGSRNRIGVYKKQGTY